MNDAVRYLDKQIGFRPVIEDLPHENLQMVLVVPAFNEPDINQVISSLYNARRPAVAVEIIIVINASSDAPEDIIFQNLKTEKEVKDWTAKNTDTFKVFHITRHDFDPRNAGVGLARKTGMDEAVYRFNLLSRPRGIIVSLDADCFVEKNYLVEIYQFFASNPQLTGCNIYFEHPLQTDCHIGSYELYLRYFVESLRYAGFPYAKHTVGSCFAVRMGIYCREGGMNRKKAGEDFYFLQKIFKLGFFGEVNTTTVYPSSRISDRVPFGTGPMLGNINNGQTAFLVYQFNSFLLLKTFFSEINALYKADDQMIYEKAWILKGFLKPMDFVHKMNEIRVHTSDLRSFKKRFYTYFNNFMIIKYLNFIHKKFFVKQPVKDMVNILLAYLGRKQVYDDHTDTLLLIMRKLQKERGNFILPPL